jgi:peptidyl-prolyl cis-trans isomerase D
MLNFLRKRASSWFIKVAFALIILVFIFWGIGTIREREQNTIGEVEGKKISLSQFQNTVNIVSENYKAILGDKFDYKILSEQIKKTAWDMLVDQAILTKTAEELKIKVSPEEVIDEIQKNDAFKENGVFKRERYIEILRYNKILPSQYEAQIEKSLLLKKVKTFLKNSVTASNDETTQWYILKNRKIKAGYITLSYKDFTKDVSITDGEIKKYYEDNKEQFKKPEKANVVYYLIPHSELTNSIKVEEKDLKDYYDEHKDEFFEPKKFLLRHIFVSFGKNKEQARKKIEDAKKALKKEDFAKVASKYNDDGTKQRGGSLGYITLSMVTPKLSEKIAGLKKGDVTDIVESEFGYHIIKVEDVVNEAIKPFESVKEEVHKKVIQNKTRLIALKNASEIKEALEKGIQPKTTFKPNKVTIEKGQSNIGDLTLPELVNNIFTLMEGKTFGPFNTSKGVIIGKLEKIEKGFFDLLEVENKVKEQLIKKKALDLAEEKAKKIIAQGQIEKGNVTDWFSPVANVPLPLNNLKEIDKELPSLNKQNKILQKPFRSDDSVYIIYLADIEEPTVDTNSEEYKNFAKEFIENKQNFFFEEWLKNAKKNAKIKLNEELFKKI